MKHITTITNTKPAKAQVAQGLFQKVQDFIQSIIDAITGLFPTA